MHILLKINRKKSSLLNRISLTGHGKILFILGNKSHPGYSQYLYLSDSYTDNNSAASLFVVDLYEVEYHFIFGVTLPFSRMGYGRLLSCIRTTLNQIPESLCKD